MVAYHPRRILAVEDSARRLSLARRCLAALFRLSNTRQLKSYGLYTPRAALRAVRKLADGAFVGLTVVKCEFEPEEPKRGLRAAGSAPPASRTPRVAEREAEDRDPEVAASPNVP